MISPGVYISSLSHQDKSEEAADQLNEGTLEKSFFVC
jgi:hypothetical protein